MEAPAPYGQDNTQFSNLIKNTLDIRPPKRKPSSEGRRQFLTASLIIFPLKALFRKNGTLRLPIATNLPQHVQSHPHTNLRHREYWVYVIIGTYGIPPFAGTDRTLVV